MDPTQDKQTPSDEVANQAIENALNAVKADNPVRVPGELVRQIELWGEWLEAAYDDPI